MLMFQYWLISDNKGTTLMADVNDRGNCRGCGEWGIWELYTFLLSFFVNQNCSKKKVYFLKRAGHYMSYTHTQQCG